MFEKNMLMAYLLDLYGDVLDEHSRDVMKAYYEDDLSLSEIAEGEKISRQGVRHIIKKCEEELEFLESKLHLSQHYMRLEQLAARLREIAHTEACGALHSSIRDEIVGIAVEMQRKE